MKYEHTPLHATVAQLVDRLLPTLQPPPVTNTNTPSANRSAKAKRPPLARGEESGQRKKRKKETRNDGEVQTDNAVQYQAPESAPTVPHESTVLKIPPLEAARRAELANNLLRGRNIDPTTLSAEQFNIFSNQAPHLQEASLEMLAKYGAERLRIVHPSEKDQPVPSASTPDQQATPVHGGTETSTPTTGTPLKKKKARKNKSHAVVVENTENVAEATSNLGLEATPGAQAQRSSKKRKTRGICNTCKLAARKCTKEHPQCSVCLEAGDACVYLAPIPRDRTSVILPEAVHDGESENSGEDMNQTSNAPPTPEPTVSGVPAVQAAQIVLPIPAPDDDEFIPDPNILSELSQHPPPLQPRGGPLPYYQAQNHASSAPRKEPAQPAAPQQHNAVMSALSFSQSQVQKNVSQVSPGLDVSTVQTARAAQVSPPVNFSTPTTAPARQRTSRSSRRSLPIPQNAQTATASSNITAPTQPPSSWDNNANSSVTSGRVNTRSPRNTQKQPSKPPNSERSGAGSNTPTFDRFQAAAVLSQTPVPLSYQNESSTMTGPPFQNPAPKPSSRANSRQTQRSQTKTPVTQTPVPVPVIPGLHSTASNVSFHTPATSSNTSSIPAYDPFTRFNNTSDDQYPQSGGAQSNPIAYEPHSYSQVSNSASSNTYTTPSYDYSRGSISALNDTSNYSNTNSSNAGQWATQNGSSQPSTRVNPDSASYKAGNSARASPAYSHATRSTQRQPTTQTAAYSQSQTQQQPQQQQSYSSYSQQPAGGVQNNSNWYGFASADNNTQHANYSDSTRAAGYDQASSTTNSGYHQGQRSNASDYNGYGQDIYDLLRTGGSH